jgi:hypothetical protein
LIALKPDISEKEKRELVGRVLQSSALSSSRALQGFLQFITDHAMSGDVDAIKEQRIGSEVLGRKDNYDPATDNIVRVRAHELRQKLEKYFTTGGIAEPVVITIPKGSYVPSFVARSLPDATSATTTPPPSVESLPIPVQSPPHTLAMRWLPWGLVGALTLTLILKSIPAISRPSIAPAATRDFWTQLFHDDEHVLTFVSADAGFALWQDITGQSIELGDYITRRFSQSNGSDPKLNESAARLFTSPADVTVALKVAEVGASLQGRVRHRNARDMTTAELHSGNAVLMGSRRSNPWVGLFESRMNFILAAEGDQLAPHFRNREPARGEPSDFAIASRFDSLGAEKEQMVSYAVAALVPNLSGTGLVLILEGLNMEGTAAVGDVVTNPEKLSALLRKLGHKPGTPVEPFEVLMKLTSIPGGFAYPEVVAARCKTASPKR